MNRRQRKYAIGAAYTVPSVRLIELESEAPLLAGSVDEFQGDTEGGETSPGSGIGLEDFDNGGTITFP